MFASVPCPLLLCIFCSSYLTKNSPESTRIETLCWRSWCLLIVSLVIKRLEKRACHHHQYCSLCIFLFREDYTPFFSFVFRKSPLMTPFITVFRLGSRVKNSCVLPFKERQRKCEVIILVLEVKVLKRNTVILHKKREFRNSWSCRRNERRRKKRNSNECKFSSSDCNSLFFSTWSPPSFPGCDYNVSREFMRDIVKWTERKILEFLLKKKKKKRREEKNEE